MNLPVGGSALGGSGSAGSGEGHRRGPDLGGQQAIQVTGAHRQMPGEAVHPHPIDQPIIDGPDRTSDQIATTVPLG